MAAVKKKVPKVQHPKWWKQLESILGKEPDQIWLNMSAANVVWLLQLAIMGRDLNPAEIERIGQAIDRLEDDGHIRVRRQGPRDGTTVADTLRMLKKVEGEIFSPSKAVTERKVWLSLDEFQRATGHESSWMIREWCRTERARSRKIDPDNPRSEWVIHQDEVDRYMKNGPFFKKVPQPDRQNA